MPLTANSESNTVLGYVEILIDASRVRVHGDVALQMRMAFPPIHKRYVLGYVFIKLVAQ